MTLNVIFDVGKICRFFTFDVLLFDGRWRQLTLQTLVQFGFFKEFDLIDFFMIKFEIFWIRPIRIWIWIWFEIFYIL
jgi:hypothetical protein